MNKPEISVIMPVLNAEKYVAESVNSILDQTFNNFEFIIIDDGSDDNSIEIIKSFNDSRIKLYKRPNLGISEQLNFGIKNSSAKIIARMDADDISFPERLDIQLKFLKTNKEIGLVGTNMTLINNEGRKIIDKVYPEKNEQIEYMMPILTSVCHPSIVAYKFVFYDAGLYNDNYLYAEDQDLFLRMLLSGTIMYNIQKILYSYRVTQNLSDYKKYSDQSKSSYRIGKHYLAKVYAKNNSFDFFYRSALLEYYNGDISIARKYFIQAIRKYPGRVSIIIRYLIMSCLGNKMVWKLREKGILNKISFLLRKYFRKDLNIVKS